MLSHVPASPFALWSAKLFSFTLCAMKVCWRIWYQFACDSISWWLLGYWKSRPIYFTSHRYKYITSSPGLLASPSWPIGYNSVTLPSQCTWKLTSYRRRNVILYLFDVNMHVSEFGNPSCFERLGDLIGISNENCKNQFSFLITKLFLKNSNLSKILVVWGKRYFSVDS